MLPATLLIVDDKPTNLADLSSPLLPHYAVRAATSGEGARHAAPADAFIDGIARNNSDGD